MFLQVSAQDLQQDAGNDATDHATDEAAGYLAQDPLDSYKLATPGLGKGAVLA